jgi:hypothetical protein
MKLEKKKKQERPSYQHKHSYEHNPEGIILRVVPLSRRYFF